MDIQELISRGRFIFSGAPMRLKVFSFVNGRKSAKEIAKQVGKSINATLNDLKKITNMDLICPKKNSNGDILKKAGSIIYEKTPLARNIPPSYFKGTTKLKRNSTKKETKKAPRSRSVSILSAPAEKDILDICRHGEDQLHEFKSRGVETCKIVKEIAGFLHTKKGGLLFYGIGDNGGITGSDLDRQKFDQSIQCSIRDSLDPPAIVDIKQRVVLGYKILVVVVPPWDKRTVYQYDGRVYLRKGTNVFPAKAVEVRKLHNGEYII